MDAVHIHTAFDSQEAGKMDPDKLFGVEGWSTIVEAVNEVNRGRALTVKQIKNKCADFLVYARR